jgi:hypothetical protein
MIGVALFACLTGGVLIRLLEKIGHGGVLFMPVVGYGIGYCIGRNRVSGRVGAVLLALMAMYSAAVLTNVPSSYAMLREEVGISWLALLISVTASAFYPLFAAAHSGFYTVMLVLSFIGAWRGAVS